MSGGFQAMEARAADFSSVGQCEHLFNDCRDGCLRRFERVVNSFVIRHWLVLSSLGRMENFIQVRPSQSS